MTTILITGANRGIGLEFVKQYHGEGARVLACARVPSRAEALVQFAAKSGGNVTVHPLDVSSAASIAHLKDEVGGAALDLLINNAGVYGGEHQKFQSFDFDEWLRVLAINSLGPMRVLDALWQNVARSTQKKAIAITSMMGSTQRHDGGAFAYRSSKAALNNAMRGMALALKSHGVIVVPVHPGWVQTDMGGPNATLTVAKSVEDMRTLFAKLKPSDSGRYLSHDGAEIPW